MSPAMRKQMKNDYSSDDDLFHAIGNLRMGQLAFHMDNPGTGNHKKASVRTFVIDLQKIIAGPNWFKAKRASADITHTDVFNQLVAVAGKKEATVKNLGAVIHKLYRFPENL